MGTSLKEQAPKGTLTAKIPEQEPEPVPESPPDQPPDPTPEPDTQPDKPTPPSGNNGLVIGGGFLALLLAAGLAYLFLTAEEEQPSEPVAAPVAAPEPLPAEDLCSMEALGALDGFAAQAEALRSCASQATADAALGLLERAAAAGDADALLLFGTIYDGTVNADVIEDRIGLTFGDEPATAAEYYARAVAAGSEGASEQLATLCERMAGMDDTLARGAVADYCSN
jgi:hypothetical protein